jgi:type II secretory pathway pseudopilin PulG
MRGERGLTLLEILIAIVVLVLAVSTIAPLFAVATAAHKRGVDQTELSWLAPRVAARIQERFYDTDLDRVKGFVKLLDDGTVLVDDLGSGPRFQDDGGAAYRFEAQIRPLTSGGRGDPMPGTAFLLRVELYTREGGEPRAEKYETVILRKMRR